MPSEISLRELAKAIGVGHSALYVHFRDRDELFAVVSGQGFATLRTALAAALDVPGEDRIAALSKAYLQFARSNPAHYRAMYSPANTTAINSSHIDAECNACFAMLVQAVADTGSVSGEDAERRAIGIWCALHGLVQLGGGSGVLRYKVEAKEEAELAGNFANTLARGG